MTSLGELLADDGSKKGRLRQGPGRNLKSISMPLYAATNHNPLHRHTKNPTKLSRRSHSSVTDAVRHPPDPTLLFRPASVVKIDGFDERDRDDESGDEFSDKVQKEDRRYDRRGDINPAPAIDEAATRAIVSILAGYIRMFFKDDNFRASLRHSCLSWLQSCRKEGGDGHEDDEPVAKLENSIEAVEKAVEGVLDSKQMKQTSLKLSLMAGLSSEDSNKNEYTSGIPNSYLSACSHLYLSFICKLQKKDKVSAKHLLQVFCDSPNQARTELLPAIWSHLFFPHLCHLKVWYEKETEAIVRSPDRKKRLQVLHNVYSSALDEGTYKFATYYKEWLMEVKEGPDLPIIDVPATESFPNYPEEASPGPSDPVPSQPMVSKRLYDSVFSHLNKITVIEEVEEEEEEDDDDDKEGGTVDKHNTVAERTTQEIDNKDKNSGEDIGVVEQDMHAPSNGSHQHKSSSWNIPEEKELIVECEDVRSYPSTKHPDPVPQQVKDHELALKKLAGAVFQHHSNDVDDFTMPYPQKHPEHDLHQSNQRKSKETKNGVKNNAVAYTTKSGAEPFGCYEGIDQGSFFSSIPKEFMCPLTGHLFKDPVTLESGQTFERTAIEEWFKQGGKTCPVTRRALESLSVPATNFVLKRLINGWKSEHCRNLLVFATQIAGNVVKDHKSKDEAALFIVEQLLTAFDTKERKENARHLISLGGTHFLTRRLELGNLDEKIRVVSLLLFCIEADGNCRSFLSMNIRGPWILELLHSKKTNSRANAVKLMIELICLNRRLAIRSFLNGLHTQAIVNTMHVLLVYLQTSLPSERALVAVLLLHLDLMVEPRRYSIYREEAVDGIIAALECSISDRKLTENSRRALLMLGGHFSSSGEILTEDCLLKKAGYYTNPISASVDYDDEIDEIISKEEEKEREEWSNNIALVLVSNGKRSLLDTLARCLASKNSGIVRVCLIVVTWLSHALPSLSAAGFELSKFIDLVPLLKECMKNDSNMENRVLASMSLLNLSKISACRVLLRSFAKEMIIPLENLMEVSWTAEQLCTAIFGEN